MMALSCSASDGCTACRNACMVCSLACLVCSVAWIHAMPLLGHAVSDRQAGMLCIRLVSSAAWSRMISNLVFSLMRLVSSTRLRYARRSVNANRVPFPLQTSGYGTRDGMASRLTEVATSKRVVSLSSNGADAFDAVTVCVAVGVPCLVALLVIGGGTLCTRGMLGPVSKKTLNVSTAHVHRTHHGDHVHSCSRNPWARCHPHPIAAAPVPRSEHNGCPSVSRATACAVEVWRTAIIHDRVPSGWRHRGTINIHHGVGVILLRDRIRRVRGIIHAIRGDQILLHPDAHTGVVSEFHAVDTSRENGIGQGLWHG
jgi:hypothetical protein